MLPLVVTRLQAVTLSPRPSAVPLQQPPAAVVASPADPAAEEAADHADLIVPAKKRRPRRTALPDADLRVREIDPSDIPDPAAAATAAAEGTVPAAVSYTPLLQEISDIQKQNPDHVLFIQVGSFYEIYDLGVNFDDIASLLGLRIGTVRNRKTPVRFVGFPLPKVSTYISILLKNGRSVAIVDQIGKDNLSATKNFNRGVVRIISPGTNIDADDAVASSPTMAENSFLLCISPAPSLLSPSDASGDKPASDNTATDKPAASEDEDDGDGDFVARITPRTRLGLSWIDVGTNEFFTTESCIADLESEVARIAPKEILVPEGFFSAIDNGRQVRAMLKRACHVTSRPHALFKSRESVARFESLWVSNHPEIALSAATGSGPVDLHDLVLSKSIHERQIASAAGLLAYVDSSFPLAKLEFRIPTIINESNTMRLSAATLDALEIVRNMRDHTVKGSLLGSINTTRTAPGSRMLAARLKSPSTDAAEISRRLDLVEAFYAAHPDLGAAVSDKLRSCSDINRSVQRMHIGTASTADFRNIMSTLQSAADLSVVLSNHPDTRGCQPLQDLVAQMGKFDGLLAELKDMLVDDGGSGAIVLGSIARGFSQELDSLREDRLAMDKKRLNLRETFMRQFDHDFVFVIDQRHGAALDFPRIAARRRADLEAAIGRDRKAHVLPHRTLASSIRVRHEKWSALYHEIQECEERLLKLEMAIFENACEKIKQSSFQIIELAHALAEIDVSCSLGLLAREREFVRPVLVDEPVHRIKDGRHPVVEHFQSQRGQNFISNDAHLADTERLWILTGPNMGGKSTFLRQCGLMSILAQAGSFVPAKSASMGIVDNVFSRIGSADDLSANESTFMIEMRETAYILQNATPRSLVIMDEVGRGTSTMDGLSLAYGIVEHLVHVNRSRGLFSTHYHELARLVEQAALPGVGCYKTTVDHSGTGHLACLYRIEPGVITQSYGIVVAAYAGLPETVIESAAAIHKRLEREAPLDGGAGKAKGRSKARVQHEEN
ncbi:MutS protein 1 [Polyrhizophydium stewartii]|uniref:MutS protein 1 n=1 Tax=Polyrhizophydium stewartii TaxID=2732419 RepID=A0ABR4NKL2_9FUNG